MWGVPRWIARVPPGLHALNIGGKSSFVIGQRAGQHSKRQRSYREGHGAYRSANGLLLPSTGIRIGRLHDLLKLRLRAGTADEKNGHGATPTEPEPRRRVPSSPTPRRKGRQAAVLYQRDSSVGRAVEVLRELGKPLHVNEIIAQIEQRGYKVKKTTLVGMISIYVKRGVLFERVKPNTFGLIEWQKNEAKH